jgi:hypothetical protein
VAAAVTLRNTGLRDLASTRVELVRGDGSVTATCASLPPDSTATLAFELVPRRTGALDVAIVLLGSGPQDTLTLAGGAYQVGPADVSLTEVMAAPDDGGEWCEILNSGVQPRSLAELALGDADGVWRGLPDVVLEPGECRLLAEDAAALAALLAARAAAGAPALCDAAPPIEVSGWPSLNNAAPAGRDFADRLLLGTVEGTILDHVTIGLGSGRAPQGRSFERGADRSWRPATATVGATPGCLPPEPPSPGADVVVRPNPFRPGEGLSVLHAVFTVPARARGCEVRVYDLWGGLVRDLGGDDLGPGPRIVEWDGRDDGGGVLPPGGYVLLLSWRGVDGATERAARRLVVLREATR